jgi:hypothetical protein
MRFHIITTGFNDTPKLIDIKTETNYMYIDEYLFNNDLDTWIKPIASSDSFIELTNVLIDLRFKALENKLSEEYYAKRKQSY